MRKIKYIFLLIFLLTKSTGFSQFANKIDLKKGLIAYYPFNFGSLIDESGNEINLFSDTAKPTKNTMGHDSSAIYITNGLSSKIHQPIYSKEYSISFWFKPDAGMNETSPAEPYTFIDFIGESLSEKRFLAFSYFGGEINFLFEVGREKANYMAANEFRFKQNFKANTWYFFNISFGEKNEYTLTIDNKHFTIFKFNPDALGYKAIFPNLNNPLSFGIGADNSSPFKGVFDDIRIYNRILSQDELALLYEQETISAEPQINWQLPAFKLTEVYSTFYEINYSISYPSELSKTQIWVNNELQTELKNLPKSVVSSMGRIYKFSNKITLQEGENIVKIVAFDEAGNKKGESLERIINYKPIALAAPMGKRYALVIGNGNYSNITKLKNPVNDANLMEETLAKLGFIVTKVIDGDRNKIYEEIPNFTELLAKDTTATGLLYYSGHGIQNKEDNWIVPIDAKIEDKNDIRKYGYPIGSLLNDMEDAKNAINIIILDACRNNPAGDDKAIGVGGLKKIDLPAKGTFIAFATGPNNVASDGKDGNNSKYTEALSNALQVKGWPIERVFKEVKATVSKLSNETQIPWENSSLRGEFYFKN
jgi:hypothetical protein